LKRWRVIYGVLLLLAVAAAVAASRRAYFPGDVAAARAVQSLAGDGLGWAKAMTETARVPWNFALAAATAALAWLLGGRRAALLALVSFAALSLLAVPLQDLVARPRPSPALVRVAGSSSGYSFPSVFALTYGATVGFLMLLALRHQSARVRLVVPLLGGALLAAELGAHWPSDVLFSYLLALLWAGGLLTFLHRR
jgi:membrane-associated phospholipid phosphatase